MAAGMGVARVLLVVISIFGGFSNVLLGTIDLPLPGDFVLGLLVIGAVEAASLGGASVAAFAEGDFCPTWTAGLAAAVPLVFTRGLVSGLVEEALAGVLATTLLVGALFGVLDVSVFTGVLTPGFAADFLAEMPLLAVFVEFFTAGCAADFLAGGLVFDLDAIFGLGALAPVLAGTFTGDFFAEAFGVVLSLALFAAGFFGLGVIFFVGVSAFVGMAFLLEALLLAFRMPVFVDALA